MRGKPESDVYAVRCECLHEWEKLCEQGQIDVLYGDESGVSLQPCIASGWQLKGDEVVVPSRHGGQLNCFALLSRANRCFVRTTEATVTGDWLAEQLDLFAEGLNGRLTVVVLDNAPVHKKMVREHGDRWEEQGLYVGFLPPYSPHLNIVETLWKRLKYSWLKAKDYGNKETLHTAVNAILQAVGTTYCIDFSPFKMPDISLT